MTTTESGWTGTADTMQAVAMEGPTLGPGDALGRVRAYGIRGTDTVYLALGDAPSTGRLQPIALGHGPAGEVVYVGVDGADLHIGDRVIVNPPAARRVVVTKLTAHPESPAVARATRARIQVQVAPDPRPGKDQPRPSDIRVADRHPCGISSCP